MSVYQPAGPTSSTGGRGLPVAPIPLSSTPGGVEPRRGSAGTSRRCQGRYWWGRSARRPGTSSVGRPNRIPEGGEEHVTPIGTDVDGYVLADQRVDGDHAPAAALTGRYACQYRIADVRLHYHRPSLMNSIVKCSARVRIASGSSGV